MKLQRRQEIEIKLAVANLAAIRRRLAALHARKLGRVHEQNTLFDTPQGSLTRSGRLLRLRLQDGPALLTYKGPSGPSGRYKVREEIEARCPDPAGLQAVLRALGYHPGFRYEKYRSSYRVPGLPGLVVDLDETPIGVFLELEGPPRAIDRAARLLGYGPADYLPVSYGALYRDWCRARGLRPGHMVFTRRKK
jgi:adenylate cyclase class 2